MAAEVWCEFVCASCAMSLEGRFVTGPRLPRPDLRKEAVAKGRVFRGNNVYCDQHCADRDEEGQS